jgi:hypothetical protein
MRESTTRGYRYVRITLQPNNILAYDNATPVAHAKVAAAGARHRVDVVANNITRSWRSLRRRG